MCVNEAIVINETKVAKAQQIAKEKAKTPPLFWVRDLEQGYAGEGKGILGQAPIRGSTGGRSMLHVLPICCQPPDTAPMIAVRQLCEFQRTCHQVFIDGREDSGHGQPVLLSSATDSASRS